MPYSFSSLWIDPPSDLAAKVQHCIDTVLYKSRKKRPVYVLFRADDIAVPCKKFSRLMELFERYHVPLSLAVVPAWLTAPRWEYLKRSGQKNSSLWCWHQHGWRHVNHEREGKKQEFGQSRTLFQIRADLVRGRRRLENLMGDAFYSIFTPPWNRCDANTLKLIKELGYYAVSRSQDSLPLPPEGLADFSINVDLHTRKEADPAEGMNCLFRELENSISSGDSGIMIHHNRMNDAAFSFLELLFQVLTRHKGIQLVHLKDLVTFTPP